MTSRQITDLLKDLNRELFSELERELAVVRIKEDGLQTEAARVYEFKPINGKPHFVGSILGQSSCSSILCRKIALSSGSSTECVAVAHVHDLEKTHCTFPPEEEPAAVVIAVGINYGQGAKYLTRPPAISDDTRMRASIVAAWNLCHRLGTNVDCSPPEFPIRFQLIAANFFPWITSVSWGKAAANQIEEALLLRGFGMYDPCSPILRLIVETYHRTQNKLGAIWVIFHGAGNAVPLLGSEVIRRLPFRPGKEKTCRINFAFSDNLAPPFRGSNAVAICSKWGEFIDKDSILVE